MRRSSSTLWRTGLALILAGAAALGLAAAPSAAAAVGGLGVPRSAARQIEWSKPVHLSQLRARQVPRVTPMLANAPVTCYNDTAYPVSYGGVDTWYDNTLASQAIQNTYSSALVVQVRYMWCPLYQYDPIGANFAEGYVYAVYYGNTRNIWWVEYGSQWSYTWDGASMHHNGCAGCHQPPDYYGDGLDHHVMWAGFDYSQAGRGDWAWSAQYWVKATNTADPTRHWTLAAISPTF